MTRFMNLNSGEILDLGLLIWALRVSCVLFARFLILDLLWSFR